MSHTEPQPQQPNQPGTSKAPPPKAAGPSTPQQTPAAPNPSGKSSGPAPAGQSQKSPATTGSAPKPAAGPAQAPAPTGPSQTPPPPAPGDAGGSAQPPKTSAAPRRKGNSFRLIVLLLLLGGLGVAGYFIVPQVAESALVDKDELVNTQARTAELKAEKLALEDKIALLRRRLERSAEDVEAAEARAEDQARKLDEAEMYNSRLTEEIEDYRRLVDEKEAELARFREELMAVSAEAAQFEKQARELGFDNAGLTGRVEDLGGRVEALSARNDALDADLAALRADHEDFRRMLGLLEVGSGSVPAECDRSAQMPVTCKELTAVLGTPEVSISQSDQLLMRWGSGRRARSQAGVVLSVDDTPVDRPSLLTVGGEVLGRAQPAAPWRLAGEEGSISFVDLVDLFGRPEGVTGSGDDFHAWWTVGAWAQKAAARVVEGQVVAFAGRPADADLVCRLVPQRRQAYQPDNDLAANIAAECRQAYRQAVKLIREEYEARSAVLARDGIRLTRCEVAPFETVGAWVAPSDVVANAYTVRAAVDCTWTRPDETSETTRQFVVVTLIPGQKPELKEFALMAGDR
jgi:hypothetical protein